MARLSKNLAGWRSWFDAHELAAEDEEDLSAEDLDRLPSLGYI